MALYEFREGKSADLQGGYRAANGKLTLKFSDKLVFVGHIVQAAINDAV
jgi:hypothetical protein